MCRSSCALLCVGFFGKQICVCVCVDVEQFCFLIFSYYKKTPRSVCAQQRCAQRRSLRPVAMSWPKPARRHTHLCSSARKKSGARGAPRAAARRASHRAIVDRRRAAPSREPQRTSPASADAGVLLWCGAVGASGCTCMWWCEAATYAGGTATDAPEREESAGSSSAADEDRGTARARAALVPWRCMCATAPGGCAAHASPPVGSRVASAPLLVEYPIDRLCHPMHRRHGPVGLVSLLVHPRLHQHARPRHQVGLRFVEDVCAPHALNV